MAWRKWIVRGIVYGILGVAATGAFLYQRWTNPAAVRDQVIAALAKTFPGAQVSVDSARLRILGGIQLNGLRFSRLDDAEKHEFLHVPSAIFYHDKEKILDGELALRKIELHRPRLRIRRASDGKWNLHGLTRKPGDKAMPALVIHQGSLILEDRSNPARPINLEINELSLAMINDPVSTIAIRGAANSELLGKLNLQGTVDRRTNEAYLSFRAVQLPLTQTLLARLPMQCPPGLFDQLQLTAQAKIEGSISYHPQQPQPVYYDIRCEVSDGSVQHPKLPLPLEKLALELNCVNGELHVENLTAESGATRIAARGTAKLPCVDQDFEAEIDLKHVILGKELSERLPLKLRNLHELFQPEGPTTIHIACAKQEGEWMARGPNLPSYVTLTPENISLTFKKFAYPLERTTGFLKYNLQNQQLRFKLLAHASADRPVEMWGHWHGEGPQADVKFEITAKDVPMDEKLLQALATDNLKTLHHFAESIHATGKLDINSLFIHEPGKAFQSEYHLHFHDATLCWDKFPLLVKNVSGYLDILPDQPWEFHDFQGTHKDGHVMLNGKSVPRVDANGNKTYGVSLEITGRKVPLDDALHQALKPMPGLYKSWETFRPAGNLYFTAFVHRPSEDLNELDVKVDVRGSTVNPMFFEYQIQDMSGLFHFHHNALEITKLNAKHNDVHISMDAGKVDLNPRGGYFADFKNIEARGLLLDGEFTDALPPKLQDVARRLKLRDPLKVKTRAVIYQPPETGKPPDVYWDGQVWLHDAKITTGLELSNVTGTLACIGRYNGRQLLGVDGNALLDNAMLYGQPFKNVHAKFSVLENSPDVLLVGLRAPIFGGDVTGQIRLDLNSAMRYEMNLTASQINIAEFGRQNLGPKSQLSGAANARLHLTGFGSGMSTLDGNGSIDIPRGHLYNLPFLLDLLKFLGLHWPDRTAFEEFHAAYSIQGSKVHVNKLDLLGSAVSLSGKGEFDMQTNHLQLDVYPMWGRIEQLLPTAIRPLPTTLSKNLLTVDVRGQVSSSPKDLKFTLKPIPVIVDPLLLLRNRMIGVPDTRGENVGLPLPSVSAPLDMAPRRWFRIWE
jgi:hypothetical protein